MTWNNDFSDIGDNTLIRPRTELFQTASLLKEGQPVAFSGTFIPDGENCIKESSMTLRGKLDNPEFIFRFSSVARYTPGASAPREQRPVSSTALPGRSGNTASRYGERGNARYQEGDLDGAIEDYNEAIRLNPDNALLFLGRSVVRRKKGDLDGAIEDCDEAIRLKPDEALFFDNRGLERDGKGDLGGAIEDYTEAIRLSPDDSLAFLGRSDALRKRGDLSAAQQDYNRAIELGYVAPRTARE